MVVSRHVVQRGGQTLVSIPKEVRKRLGLRPRALVYWHLTRGGEAILSPKPVRKGGRPADVRIQDELTAALAENERLQGQLRELPGKIQAQAWRHRAMQHLAVELNGLPVLDAINDRLRNIQAHLGTRLRPMHTQAKRRSARTEAVPGPDDYPDPSARPDPSAPVHEEERSSARPIPGPSPSPDVFEEGGVGAGRPLPGQP